MVDSAYLKDPPANYFYPPHDIFAYLASVKAKLENDIYANEYEFQEDLYQVFARAHDGHLVFYPKPFNGADRDLLCPSATMVSRFLRSSFMVSFSVSCRSEMAKKFTEDVVSSPSTAPVVVLINGIDAATYVEDFIYTASFNQDADAAYNTMFSEKAFVAGGVSNGYFSGGGRIRYVIGVIFKYTCFVAYRNRYIYPGNVTTFSFSNRTTLSLENIAQVKGNFTGVVDGESFYSQFCTGPQSSVSAAAGSTSLTGTGAAASGITATGYPSPVVITNDTIVSGYYLKDTGYEGVAVLALLAFESESPLEFQMVAQQFLADAVRDGKTKLVVDLSANGGGYILQGYDMFRQLFPDIVQDGYTRLRENGMLQRVAEIFSTISEDFDLLTATSDEIYDYENILNYRYDLNLTNQPFESFDAKFGPHVYMGDNFTNIIRWNLTDPLTTSNATFGFGTDITGYNSRTNFTQPFEAENIIMVRVLIRMATRC